MIVVAAIVAVVDVALVEMTASMLLLVLVAAVVMVSVLVMAFEIVVLVLVAVVAVVGVVRRKATMIVAEEPNDLQWSQTLKVHKCVFSLRGLLVVLLSPCKRRKMA